MYVYTTSVQCQSDIHKTTSNCNMEVDQTLSSSSIDVIDIYNDLAVIRNDKSSVAATCQVLTVRIADMQQIQHTVDMFKSWRLVLSVVWIDS